jgi:hypothetical protein
MGRYKRHKSNVKGIKTYQKRLKMQLNEVKMKIGLETDFYDYYDYWFPARYEEVDSLLDRRARAYRGIDKIQQFWIMEQEGLRTPHHGVVRDMYENGFDKTGLYVVYLDPLAHQGEGKVLESLQGAYDWHKDSYASRWVRSVDVLGRSRSMRILGVGRKRYTLYYTGIEREWRSNVGDGVEIYWNRYDNKWVERLGLERGFDDYPLWAVDFVQNDWGDWVAVDFNTAPQIRGTGIEDVVEPYQMYRDIVQWYEDHEGWV